MLDLIFGKPPRERHQIQDDIPAFLALRLSELTNVMSPGWFSRNGTEIPQNQLEKTFTCTGVTRN